MSKQNKGDKVCETVSRKNGELVLPDFESSAPWSIVSLPVPPAHQHCLGSHWSRGKPDGPWR